MFIALIREYRSMISREAAETQKDRQPNAQKRTAGLPDGKTKDTYRDTMKQIKKTDTQTDRLIDIRTCIQRDRQTDRQTH